ncbi:MAG: carbohydrate kinase [Synechococcaceae cyanobacterium]|nr:carbohydrate kinase [Synechococcaceae cyanobacterium]
MNEEGSLRGARRPRVLCFGEALVDRLFPPGVDPEASAASAGARAGTAAGTPAVEDHLGGAPANVACALARLGTPVAFLGRLGEDAIGASFRALFAERGVETSALQWDRDRPSRVVLVRRDASGERSFGGFAGDRGQGFADQAVDAAALAGPIAPLLEGAAWLLVGTIPLASPASAEALEEAVGRAAGAGVALAVDVNWRPTFWDPAAAPEAGPTAEQIARIRPLLEQAALIKCAAEEARWLFQSLDPQTIRAALPRRPAVLITDGADPLRWSLGEHSGTLPAFRVPVVDTTGAGDAFTAGLLHGLCRAPALPGGGTGDLVRFASACGALVCQGAGAIAPQPTAQQVETFLSERGLALP